MLPPTIEESVPTSGLDLLDVPYLQQNSATTILIDIKPGIITPTSYDVVIIETDDNFNELSSTTQNKVPPLPLSVTLSKDKIYKIQVFPKNGVTTGNGYTVVSKFKLSTSYTGVSATGNPSSTGTTATARVKDYGVEGGDIPATGSGSASSVPIEASAGQSYLNLSNTSTSKSEYVVAYKEFDSLTAPAYTVVSTLPIYEGGLYIPKSYSSAYYAFGTSIYLNAGESSSGIGFFVDDEGKKGYYIIIETVVSAAAQDKKTVRICKANTSGIKVLSDSQKNTVSSFDSIFSLQQYNLDVYIKTSGQSITIDAYINGFKISATDTNSYVNNKPDYIHPFTKKIAMLCGPSKAGQAAVSFDYAYATDITEEIYNKASIDKNLYIGKFSNDLINTTFGDLVYDAKNAEDTLKPAAVEDFGTVVREIYHVSTKIKQRPAYPLKWSAGGNDVANIIAQKVSNFSAEAYVLNNTSTTVPLNNGATAAFYLYGNSVGQSGDLEYTTDETEEYVEKQPVAFKTQWLQNISDVKSLANWIKTKAVNKGKIVMMNIFGNPLLSVGDIILVKYTYQGLSGTEKMIITSISLSYNEGIETSITARTL